MNSRATIFALLVLPAMVQAQVIRVDPPRLELNRPGQRWSILVSRQDSDGHVVDLTSQARFEIDHSRVAVVSGHIVRATGDGDAQLTVTVASSTIRVPIKVRGQATPRGVHFENDIEPLFGRFGCNSAGCHGKAEGQNGFKLSVFGSDPEADYSALVKEGRGRRLFASSPDQSLFLRKASGQVAHGGGSRMLVGSDGYEAVRQWIAAGSPVGRIDAPTVVQVRVEPDQRVLAMRSPQQLRALAEYSDGRIEDVTHFARFQSNGENVASVNAFGLVNAGDVPGDVAIMASFANKVAVFRAIVPQNAKVDFPKLPQHNFIDQLVDTKLQMLRVAPSGICDDATFLRRAYIDVAGMLPTVEVVRQFERDSSPTKRQKLIDDLLSKPEYAELWALRWSDVLRVDRQALGHQRAFAYYRWLRQSIATNRPFDAICRDMVQAEGPLDEVPQSAFYKVIPKPGEAANVLSQVFLGVRLACAECHHHPADRWSQTDYYAMAAFFTPIGVRKIGSMEAVTSQGEAVANHLRTGKPVAATPLGRPGATGKGDRREELASWMTSRENPYFARNLANRIWAHLLGRGLVDPVDDVRSTNPPTNPELLDALAKFVVDSRFDVKALIRLICSSRAYQTTTTPNASNAKDDRNYSRGLLKRPDAEVLLDMISHALGVPEKFEGAPEGTRAVQLWDSKLKHYFLTTFGRPARVSSCECERVGEPNIAQVLHLLNGETVQDRLRHDSGNVARWCRTIAKDDELAVEMYLTILSRSPTIDEKKRVLEYVAKNEKSRRAAWEDVAWALINTKEFLFNH